MHTLINTIQAFCGSLNFEEEAIILQQRIYSKMAMITVLVLMKHCLFLILVSPGMGYRLKGMDIPDKRHHKVQHGQCSYTFLLPEIENCYPTPADYQVSNSLQRDAPSQPDVQWPSKKIQELESIMENNTQWLQKVTAPG